MPRSITWLARAMMAQGVGHFLYFALCQAFVTVLLVAPGADEPFLNLLAVLYTVLALWNLALGTLLFWAGWRTRELQGRKLCAVALVASLGGVLGYFCFPTGLILAVFGLVVQLDPRVGRAYALAAAEPIEPALTGPAEALATT